VPLASLFNLIEVDGQNFHFMREALLHDGAIDRCADCRDRSRRRRDGRREANEANDEDDDAEEEEEEDHAPCACPVASAGTSPSRPVAAAPSAHPDTLDEIYNDNSPRLSVAAGDDFGNL
jgi:hypothetical protein